MHISLIDNQKIAYNLVRYRTYLNRMSNVPTFLGEGQAPLRNVSY